MYEVCTVFSTYSLPFSFQSLSYIFRFLVMAATATAVSVEPRYAPEDPTLPKPWKGLVDGKTGYLYFWNPETNATQYERPVPAAPLNSSVVSISSSVQIQKQASGHSYYNNFNENNEKYGRSVHEAPKHEVESNISSLFYFIKKKILIC